MSSDTINGDIRVPNADSGSNWKLNVGCGSPRLLHAY